MKNTRVERTIDLQSRKVSTTSMMSGDRAGFMAERSGTRLRMFHVYMYISTVRISIRVFVFVFVFAFAFT